ncbi:MAG: hypothetical protein CMK49_02070 [Prochlorococcus sp. SP3034]|nr:hypothetical protein [Prochlorococcus sp. SP3034]
MSKILILSNGHGEDLSGSLLAKELTKMGHTVDALPIVGNGGIYKKNEIKVVCKTKEFSTGGLGYNSLKGRINDLFNGQIIYLFNKLLLTFLIRKQYKYFLVVGDIVPITFAWLCGKKFFVYLVAYSSHYEGKLRLPWPSKLFLSSSRLKNLYTRDLFTANDLTNQLGRKVFFYGNPFMDVFLSYKKEAKQGHFNILLLPGSRTPEIINNFNLMISILENLSKYQYFKNVELNFAIVNNLSPHKIINILSSNKWSLFKSRSNTEHLVMKYKSIIVNFRWNSFEECLFNSDLVLSMSGTAAEQAVGLNKPVIQIEGYGPQFTKSFADAQRRLLGEYIFCITEYKSKKEKIEKTIDLIIQIMYLIRLNKNFLISCRTISKQRIGGIGASIRIIEDINNIINS